MDAGVTKDGTNVPAGKAESECVQDIVFCLLDAKGKAHSTPSVQVAINSSVIQVAKSDFPLVVTSIFSCLEQQQGTESHQLGLLRLLCQVLETRRSDCDGASACTVDLPLARSLSAHLVAEVARLPFEDSRIEAISDVLVELVPTHPDVVLNSLLTKLDNPGASSAGGASPGGSGNTTAQAAKAQGEQPRATEALVKILTEIAYTTPHAMEDRLSEIMNRYLPLLQACKPAGEMRLLLYRAWCSLCVAMVNCAVREPRDPISSTESAFSRCFGAAAISVRRRDFGAGTGGGARHAAGHGGAASSDDRRRGMQALGTTFTILMSSWQATKDLALRAGAMETLGHLSLVIPKDQFLTNADSLLELLLNLLTAKSVSASSGLPPMRLMRGLCLFLQSCIDADPEILLLEGTLNKLVPTLFSWMVSSGPLQCLQGSVGTEALQSQAEVLRCFEVLAESFQNEVLEFLLKKLKGSRDEKLGSLLVLRHLVGTAGWRPKPAVVIEGVVQLTNDADSAVGLLLGELVAALAGADFFQVAVPGGHSTSAEEGKVVKLEHVYALLSFLINQTALTHCAEPEQSSYLAKFAKSQTTDMPTCHEVRGRAGLVLGHLAGSLKPSARLLLWPMLLQAIVSPVMRPGLPVLCRAVAQIITSVRLSEEGSAQAIADMASAFKPGHERSTQPEALLIWLLLCAHNPHEVPGLGLSVLRCLEVVSPLINRVLGDIWEPPSRRLPTLCNHLEENPAQNRFDAEFWSSALSHEVHFFLSALPEHDDLPARLIDILGALHTEIWRKDRDMSDLPDVQKAALFNMTGVCLSHIGMPNKVHSTLDFLLSHSGDLITDPTVRRACARGLGIAAGRHFDLVLGVLGKAAKTDAATRRSGSIAQSLFGKSQAVQQAEHFRAMLVLALGYCAVFAPNNEVLQEQVCEHILGPLHTALTNERALPVLLNVLESVRLANDAVRMAPESLAQRDPFLSRAEQERGATGLSQDPALRTALAQQRDNLVKALLPFLETPSEQDDEQKQAAFEELIAPALHAASSLIALPLELPSDLYASILEAGLHVLIFSIPNDTSALRQGMGSEDVFHAVDPTLAMRINAVTQLIKSLLFHAHSWLGVSLLLKAVYAAGAGCPVEFIRWTCTQLLGELCTAAPILEVPQVHDEELHNDVGNWCECLALLLPRTGDSCRPIVAAAIDALQQLLSRCGWTADVRLGDTGAHGAEERARCALSMPSAEDRPPTLERTDGSNGDLAPPSQQLVAALVQRLPPAAIPPLVQHLMPTMHDADSRAALSGVDALYLILEACSEKLSAEGATSLMSTVFAEVEKVSHSSVRQRVLSCIKVLALHHFDPAIAELLDKGPDFNTSILCALQVLAKEKALLLRLLNHFTDTLNNSDPNPQKKPNRLVLAATVALGHLFTVNDSSIGMVVKKYFPQLFGTFLLRIGTTAEGLSAQQTAGAFMNFLHASQNDSMAMALEGNRLSRVNRDLYDEVISELTGLFCRHHPGKRVDLLGFIKPFHTRPFSGHRVATISALAQLLASGADGSLDSGILAQVVHILLERFSDKDKTVRKQVMRGLGQSLVIWQQRLADGSQIDDDLRLRQVLSNLCQALTDPCSPVQREAVVALQRAVQVEDLPLDFRNLLLDCVEHLPPLLDAGDVALRGVSLDLLGKLSALAGPPLEITNVSNNVLADNIEIIEGSEGQHSESRSSRSDKRDKFADSLELLLVPCVVRLEDTSSAVSSAAARCLTQLVGAMNISGTAAAEAQELLQRRLEEHMLFEQFVFPFVALVHRREDAALLTRRLEICRAHFAAGKRDGNGANSPAAVGNNNSGAAGGSPSAAERSPANAPHVATAASSSGCGAYSLATCVAAGFVAAAFVRCLEDSEPRPSALLCEVCRDLVDLVSVDDSEFRAQVARILGFFDILAHRPFVEERSTA